MDLFNHRYYWEAHEAWESVWHACDKSRAQGAFVQGLIQTAAALLRWHMGSERGARSLYASARQRFALVQREAPEGYMGIDWDRWLGELDAHFPIGRADAVVADATPGRTPLLEDDARARDSRGLPKASPLGPTPTRPEPPRATPGPGSSVVPPRLPLIELGFPSRTAAPAPFQSH